MAIKRTEKETDAFQALRQLETMAMDEAGLLGVLELQKRCREETLEAIDHLPKTASPEVTRAEMASFLLDSFIPKYKTSLASLRYLG